MLSILLQVANCLLMVRVCRAQQPATNEQSLRAVSCQKAHEAVVSDAATLDEEPSQKFLFDI